MLRRKINDGPMAGGSMDRKIEVPILFTIDIACSLCSCRREAVHAHRLVDGKSYVFETENCDNCSHRMEAHVFVRDTKSDFEKQRDGEI